MGLFYVTDTEHFDLLTQKNEAEKNLLRCTICIIRICSPTEFIGYMYDVALRTLMTVTSLVCYG